jgi:hypothetical protein
MQTLFAHAADGNARMNVPREDIRHLLAIVHACAGVVLKAKA